MCHERVMNILKRDWTVVTMKEPIMAKRYHNSRSPMQDSNEMISSNFSQRANLPQEVIMKDYSTEGAHLPPNYPSYGPSVVDAQISGDSNKMKSILDPRKV